MFSHYSDNAENSIGIGMKTTTASFNKEYPFTASSRNEEQIHSDAMMRQLAYTRALRQVAAHDTRETSPLASASSSSQPLRASGSSGYGGGSGCKCKCSGRGRLGDCQTGVEKPSSCCSCCCFCREKDQDISDGWTPSQSLLLLRLRTEASREPLAPCGSGCSNKASEQDKCPCQHNLTCSKSADSRRSAHTVDSTSVGRKLLRGQECGLRVVGAVKASPTSGAQVRLSRELDASTSPRSLGLTQLLSCKLPLVRERDFTDISFVVVPPSSAMPNPPSLELCFSIGSGSLAASLQQSDSQSSKPEVIHAHRFILAARTKFFETVWGAPYRMDFGEPVKVENCPPSAFHEFIQYLYTDCVEVEPRNIAALSDLAYRFRCHGLWNLCEDFLTSHLDACDPIHILTLFRTFWGRNYGGGFERAPSTFESHVLGDEITELTLTSLLDHVSQSTLSNDAHRQPKQSDLLFWGQAAQSILNSILLYAGKFPIEVAQSNGVLALTREQLEYLLPALTQRLSQIDIFKLCYKWSASSIDRTGGADPLDMTRIRFEPLKRFIRFTLIDPRDLADIVAPTEILREGELLDIYRYWAVRQ